MVGGISSNGIIAQTVQTIKQQAEQEVTQKIQEVINDPAKNLRQIQQDSPLSQFLDIKI